MCCGSDPAAWQELIVSGRHSADGIAGSLCLQTKYRIKCLHRPTFEADYKAIRPRLVRKERFSARDLAFIALYSACLCAGIQFLSDEGYRDLGWERSDGEDLAQECWRVVLAALESSDWTQTHSVYSVQAIMQVFGRRRFVPLSSC